ncbi:MFS general substrate transporter [Daldinia caldariorum]|uniref:MFS general substrate transporter n=1 Tax=Daldinia caldariorum TaxID=326644 RepID=UPI002007B5AD|nr:MFS general substrate transporter [Daldinia caldariorum]KAI1469384.1 MFS general substrate transporter [Daldinia caldariorum]
MSLEKETSVIVTASPSSENETTPVRSPVNVAPPPPPDGGTGWIQVFVGHLALFNTFGWFNSYGIFQDYYTEELNLPLSAVSWTGSVQVFLLACIGMFSGRLFDAGYFRSLILIGSFLQLLAIFMASLATEYWQLFLAQGVCGGLGAGILYCPIIACVSTYFARKRALAISLVTSGGATGGLVFPIIAQQLPGKIGFPWTMRVMGFVVMFNASVMLIFARTRLPPRPRGPIVEWAAFKELPYSLYSAGAFCILWSVYLIYNYINHYGRTILHMEPSTSLNTLFIANAVGVPGRIIPALVSDAYFGPFRTLVPLAISASVLYFGWIGVRDPAALYVFAVLSGIINGGVQTISMAGLPSLTKDLSKVGTRSGMIMTVGSFACLTGPPIAGALIDVADGRYLYMQIWAGCIMLLSAFFVTASWYASLKKSA